MNSIIDNKKGIAITIGRGERIIYYSDVITGMEIKKLHGIDKTSKEGWKAWAVVYGPEDDREIGDNEEIILGDTTRKFFVGCVNITGG